MKTKNEFMIQIMVSQPNILMDDCVNLLFMFDTNGPYITTCSLTAGAVSSGYYGYLKQWLTSDYLGSDDE